MVGGLSPTDFQRQYLQTAKKRVTFSDYRQSQDIPGQRIFNYILKESTPAIAAKES